MNSQFGNVKFRTGTNGSVTREAHYKILSSGRVKVRYSRAEDDNGYDLPNAQHCEWTNTGNAVEACKVIVDTRPGLPRRGASCGPLPSLG